MDSLRRASAFLFYLLGTLTIVAIVLLHRDVQPDLLGMFLNIVDLPLLLTGMLFGGSTLVTSIGQGKASKGLVIGVFLPLLLLFGFFMYLNFGLQLAE